MSEPHWVSSAEQDDVPLKAGIGSSSEVPLRTKSPCYFYTLKAITMLLCILMASTAVLGLSMLHGIEEAGKIFVGFYMLFFSILLFLFELVQVHPWEAADHMFQRNFGFLYSAKGKAFYIIFVAFLSFGLQEPATMCFVTGCLMAMFGVCQIMLYLKNPDLFE